MVDTIHIHEDDWGMRNLYPLAARAEAEADIDAAADAAERNRAPSGFGYTDIYIAKPPSTDYTEVGLMISDIDRVLTPILPRVQRFNATIGSAIGSESRDALGSYEEDALCFGLGNHCYIKFETDGEFIRIIWFDFHSDDQDDVDRFRRAIEAIDALAPSIIADYFLDFSGVVSEPGVLDDYIAALEERRLAVEQAMLEYRAQHEERQKPRGIFEKLLSVFTNR
jgi:hypothetical protein